MSDSYLTSEIANALDEYIEASGRYDDRVVVFKEAQKAKDDAYSEKSEAEDKVVSLVGASPNDPSHIFYRGRLFKVSLEINQIEVTIEE